MGFRVDILPRPESKECFRLYWLEARYKHQGSQVLNRRLAASESGAEARLGAFDQCLIRPKLAVEVISLLCFESVMSPIQSYFSSPVLASEGYHLSRMTKRSNASLDTILPERAEVVPVEVRRG